MTSTSFRVGFWLRFAATAIDYAVVAATCAGLGATFGALFGSRHSGDPFRAGSLVGEAAIGALVGVAAGFGLVGALYMSVEAWTDATPGKRLLGLVVAGEDGHPAAAGARVTRYLVKNCHLLLASLASLSGMWFVGTVAPLATLVVAAGSTMILMSQRQALHDVIAKTAVLRRQPSAPSAPAASS